MYHKKTFCNELKIGAENVFVQNKKTRLWISPFPLRTGAPDWRVPPRVKALAMVDILIQKTFRFV